MTISAHKPAAAQFHSPTERVPSAASGELNNTSSTPSNDVTAPNTTTLRGDSADAVALAVESAMERREQFEG